MSVFYRSLILKKNEYEEFQDEDEYMVYGSNFDKYSQNTEEIKREVEKEKIYPGHFLTVSTTLTVSVL